MITSVAELTGRGLDMDLVRAQYLVQEIIPDLMLIVVGIDPVE